MRGAEFLSTPSVRRATASQVRPPKLLDISIHALREEGDCLIVRQRGPAQDFYPRPPRGGRPVTLGCSHIRVMISIHALREEGDMCLLNLMLNVLIFLSTPSARRATGLVADIGDVLGHFYPRPPRGGRRSLGVSTLYYAEISIHALREEGDRTAHGISNAAYRFLSTPSARRATGADEGIRQAQAISIHALREEGDVTDSARSPMILSFLSTPSARRATG